MTKITYIPGEIANAAIDEHGNRKPVTRTQHIFDDAKGKSQAEVNADIDNTLALHQSEINALDSQNYATVGTFSELPATGSVDTVYRVSNWDGSANSGAGAVDATVYSEYAWDDSNSEYKLLDVKTAVGEVFDISAYHATGGELAEYADLAAALGTNGANVPEPLRKGGMSIKFVQSSDHNYVQFRYMLDDATTNRKFINVANWQGVDTEIIEGSRNLAESGAVANSVLGVYALANANDAKLNGQSLLNFTDSEHLNHNVYIKYPFVKGRSYTIKNTGNQPCNLSTKVSINGETIDGNPSTPYAPNSEWSFTATENANYLCAFLISLTTFQSLKITPVDTSSIEQDVKTLNNNSYLNTQNIAFLDSKIIDRTLFFENTSPNKNNNFWCGAITKGEKFFVSVEANVLIKIVSVYSTVTNYTLADGYTTISEVTNINKYGYVYWFEVPVSGFFLLNVSFVSTGVTGSVEVYKTTDIYAKSLNLHQQALLVSSNLKSEFPKVLPVSGYKDVYLTIIGDSIFALQSAESFPSEGVTRVPPTCDRLGAIGSLWQAINKGNVNCRRFDDGKHSLVGVFDNRWDDDSEAFFTESGIFNTEYYGSSINKTVNPDTGTYNGVQYTTKVNKGSFAPSYFDYASEIIGGQRNIPKRFSSADGASVTFTIPARFRYFDFLFHSHIDADTVTISVAEGDGKVRYSPVPNLWTTLDERVVEANGATIDLSMTNRTESGGGNDSYGIPNCRLHFAISSSNTGVTITITKSSNTSKYLIYWGIEYWGTTEQHTGIHLNNMAIGNTILSDLYDVRSSLLKYVSTTSVLMEVCLNDLCFASNGMIASVTIGSRLNTYLKNFKNYITSLEIELDKMRLIIPHAPVLKLSTNEDGLKYTYAMAESVAADKGLTIAVNMYKIFDRIRMIYFDSLSKSDFMSLMGGDGTHLGDAGYKDVYGAVWNSVV